MIANRTSLTGTGGTVRFGKAGGKTGKHGQVFKFETGLTYRSPELELNDIGFMLTANEINQFTWAGLQFQKPFSIFRNARLNIIIGQNGMAAADLFSIFSILMRMAHLRITGKRVWAFPITHSKFPIMH